jgi:hypothetical protein
VLKGSYICICNELNGKYFIRFMGYNAVYFGESLETFHKNKLPHLHGKLINHARNEQNQTANMLVLVSCLANSSALKVEGHIFH